MTIQMRKERKRGRKQGNKQQGKVRQHKYYTCITPISQQITLLISKDVFIYLPTNRIQFQYLLTHVLLQVVSVHDSVHFERHLVVPTPLSHPHQGAQVVLAALLPPDVCIGTFIEAVT